MQSDVAKSIHAQRTADRFQICSVKQNANGGNRKRRDEKRQSHSAEADDQMPVQDDRQSVREVFIRGERQWQDRDDMHRQVPPEQSSQHKFSLETLSEILCKVAPDAVNVRTPVARVVMFQQKGGALQTVIIRVLRFE